MTDAVDAEVQRRLDGLDDFSRDVYARQGQAVSDRMAAGAQRRRHLVEASHDLSEAMQGVKVGPPHEVMDRVRYPEGRKHPSPAPSKPLPPHQLWETVTHYIDRKVWESIRESGRDPEVAEGVLKDIPHVSARDAITATTQLVGFLERQRDLMEIEARNDCPHMEGLALE